MISFVVCRPTKRFTSTIHFSGLINRTFLGNVRIIMTLRSFQFKNKEELNLGYNLIDSLITELLRDCVHFVKKIIKGEKFSPAFANQHKQIE